jgi:dephospho-CoA kinase
MPKIILGITGGIASGKTTVMTLLAKAGIPTISSDDLAHDCIRRGKPAYRAILARFGREILGSDSQIDRKKLGAIVFPDPVRRRRLEKIVHPCVAKGLRQFIKRHHGVIALDIPLLFEAGYEKWFDKIIVVYASKADQIRRLGRRNGLSRQEALQRISAQMPLAAKRRRADKIIYNTGTLKHLRRQLLRAELY